jgi:hypothetical protein
MKILINNCLNALLSNDTNDIMPTPGNGLPLPEICSFRINILWPRMEEQWNAFTQFRLALTRIAQEQNRHISIPQVIPCNPDKNPYITIHFFEDHPLNYMEREFLASLKCPEIEISEIPD